MDEKSPPAPKTTAGPPAVSPLVRGLVTRILTAMVLVPLAVGVVWLGGRVYSGVVAFMLIILIFEWARIVDGAEFSRGFYTLSATAIGTVFLAAGGDYGLAVAAALGGGTLATVFQWSKRRAVSSWPAVGAMYLLLPAIAALYLRHSPVDGRELTLILFVTVWAADSAAYLAGTFIGGPKLLPALSPRKTWTGAAGGVLGGALATLILGAVLGVSAPPRTLVATGAVLAVAAIVGDLLESALKRAYGVKDTGGAFPGHGGVLDRLDGFIVAALVLAVLAMFFGFGGGQA